MLCLCVCVGGGHAQCGGGKVWHTLGFAQGLNTLREHVLCVVCVYLLCMCVCMLCLCVCVSVGDTLSVAEAKYGTRLDLHKASKFCKSMCCVCTCCAYLCVRCVIFVCVCVCVGGGHNHLAEARLALLKFARLCRHEEVFSHMFWVMDRLSRAEASKASTLNAQSLEHLLLCMWDMRCQNMCPMYPLPFNAGQQL
jgi:hypothetical protein